MSAGGTTVLGFEKDVSHNPSFCICRNASGLWGEKALICHLEQVNSRRSESIVTILPFL